ncbi:Glucose-6-phosphate isomerase [termite gut metagenome]|uniref:glucose-6-phosphate isomerase n=1 Tax=termite gut metagenome TaxID=433724 RepID=A0A5J4PSM6_9ZZZZ
MRNFEIHTPEVFFDLRIGKLCFQHTVSSKKEIQQLAGVFADEAERDTAEFYWRMLGEGVIVCMDENGNSWAETMTPNSLHYIAGCVAHRVANTGSEPLVFGACWHSGAGHDYETINKKGFSARLVEKDGKPVLIKSTQL